MFCFDGGQPRLVRRQHNSTRVEFHTVVHILVDPNTNRGPVCGPSRVTKFLVDGIHNREVNSLWSNVPVLKTIAVIRLLV